MPKSNSHMSGEKPLLGAILCCTALAQEQRSQYFEWAKELGAEYHLDLTTEVTHLLVGSTDTDKYRYVAREREDIKVVRPEWVEAVRERWMNAQALDLEALEVEYRLPVLFRLKICITGFDDLAFRAQLQKNVIENGGLYTGDLTKDVTHLIAAKPEGKKYEYGLQWQIKVVSLKWYKDTLARGMQLDELLYAPTVPFDDQGRGAWIRCKSTPQPVLGKRARDESNAIEPARKLRRTASTKLGSQNDCLWNDIVGGPSEVVTSINRPTIRASRSAPVLQTSVTESTTPTADSTTTASPAVATAPAKKGFLDGVQIYVHGFDRRRGDILENIILVNAGQCLKSCEELENVSNVKPQDRRYLQLIPHDNLIAVDPNLPYISRGVQVVTELWLEQCMSQKEFIEPRAYPLGSPLGSRPIEGFANFSVNATGFPARETLHISKVIRALGAKYDEVFTSQVSVLICSSADVNPQKVQHARQWAIPAVTEGWLWACIKTKEMAEFDNYLLYNQANQRRKRRTTSGNLQEDFPAIHRRSDKVVEVPLIKNVETPAMPLNKRDTQPEFSVYEDDADEMLLRSNPKPLPHDLPTAAAEQSGTSHSDMLISDRPPNAVLPSMPLQKVPPATTNGDESVNSAIKELLTIKAKVGSMPSATGVNKIEGEAMKKRFFGRALSNLSNSSVTSNVRYSRAGSVDSLNTDGIGSEIGVERVEKVTEPSNLSRKTSFSFTGRAKEKFGSRVAHDRSVEDDLRRERHSQDDPTPRLTQLGYEEPAEAIILRRKLAQVIEQGSLAIEAISPSAVPIAKEARLLRDDVLATDANWGQGRRTRHKDRDR